MADTCKAEGCGNKANRIGAGLCEKHYARLRRNGSTQTRFEQSAQFNAHSRGYLLEKAPGHRLSTGGARAYAHRLAFHAANGDGPFACYWCGRTVTWADMHVDHLDDDKQNNDPKNLAAACPPCNMQRGHHKVVEAHRAKTGIEYAGETLTPNEWAARIGITRQSLLWRLKNGWTMERAMTEGRGVTGPRSTTRRTN